MSALQAIEALLSVELSFREARRIKVALGTSRLMPPKTELCPKVVRGGLEKKWRIWFNM